MTSIKQSNYVTIHAIVYHDFNPFTADPVKALHVGILV